MLKTALIIGLSEAEFWNLTPARFKIHADAYNEKQKHADWERWRLGAYIQMAVAVAVTNTAVVAITGKRQNAKYPAFQATNSNSKYVDGSSLTEGEKDLVRKRLVENLKSMEQNFHQVHGQKRK